MKSAHNTRELAGLRLLSRDAGDAEAVSWGTAHAVFDASPDLAALLTRQDLEEWLDCSLLHYPVLNAVHGPTPVPPEDLTRVMTVSGDMHGGYVDGAKVRAQMAAGATVVIQNLHDWHRPARVLCRRLAEQFAAKAGAAAFWSPAGEEGLRAHRDDGHLFVIQVHGTKRWYLYDVPQEPSAWKPGYVDDLDNAETVDLRPGQVLYLPDGLAHHTRSMDTDSVHVTVAIREPSLRDTAELALRACIANIPAHATLSGTAAEREQAVDDLLARLADALGRVDRGALVGHLERRAVEARGSR